MFKKISNSKNKKYKFYTSNLWGGLFLTRRFRGRDVLLARINRRMVSKVLDVSPVKLRKRRLSVEGQGLRSKYMLKRFYFNYKEYQLRKVFLQSYK